jgi:hypothetical protein
MGKLTVARTAFRRLSEPVPPACYSIVLQAKPWRFGGKRWFFVCPNGSGLVLKLFLPNGAHRFAGRVAHGLAYRSERLSKLDAFCHWAFVGQQG